MINVAPLHPAPASDARVPKGTWKDGAIDYGNLEKYYLGSYTRYWRDETEEPWLYNSTSGIMITCEDTQSLGVKADYVRVRHLGSIMIRQLSADNAQHALVDAPVRPPVSVMSKGEHSEARVARGHRAGRAVRTRDSARPKVSRLSRL